jgi:hypothetical protein
MNLKRFTIHIYMKVNRTVLEFLGGNLNVFPFQKCDPNGPLRSKDNYDQDILKANLPNDQKRLQSHGIKNTTVLSELKYYHPVLSTTIDYMHSFLEGKFDFFIEMCKV